MARENDEIYCLDASAMIELSKKYPVRIFPGIWAGVEQLATSGRLITFKGIADECHDEECTEWSRLHKGVIRPFSEDLNECLNQLLGELASSGRRMFNPSAEKDERDPFLIALAMAERKQTEHTIMPATIAVLAEEARVGANAITLKIPNVCDLYGIPCFNVLQMFENEHWSF